MGIDLGHSVYDARKLVSYLSCPTSPARGLQVQLWSAAQWKQPAKKKHQESKRKVKQKALHSAANQGCYDHVMNRVSVAHSVGLHTRRQLHFCLERLCRLIAVGHVGRHPKKRTEQRVKQMPHSVALLPEPPSAGPPRASEREEPERLPGWSMRVKSSNTTICQRHLMQADRHRMCLERRPIELCHTCPPHRGWPNGRCKQSGRRRPNLVHLAGLPHCQHAGVDCAWVLHCRNRAREAEVPASIPPATPCYCSCTMPRCMAA